jgi:hypothetical protein
MERGFEGKAAKQQKVYIGLVATEKQSEQAEENKAS